MAKKMGDAAEVPKALGWLAAHWKGVPNIAGIEIPWNEPGGPLTQGQAYYDLCRECARAVKAADPERLVFMDCVDWGAVVNRIPDESVWRVPDEIDALFPHFYPGMHSNSSGQEGTWSSTMANWVSWMMGSGRPVMVGEYGVVEMARGQYWKDGPSDAQKAATYAACAAQWYAMGVQGLFCWAWDGGIGRDTQTGALTEGAQELSRWAAPFRQTAPCNADARIAVICSPKRRATEGCELVRYLSQLSIVLPHAILDLHDLADGPARRGSLPSTDCLATDGIYPCLSLREGFLELLLLALEGDLVGSDLLELHVRQLELAEPTGESGLNGGDDGGGHCPRSFEVVSQYR